MSLRLDLLWRAARTPDAPALETPQATWSFAELADRARRVAAYARAEPGAGPVALLLEGGAEFAAWFHGLALAGRTVLPLNLRLTPGELVQQLEDARAELLIGAASDPRLALIAGRLPSLRIEPAPGTGRLPASRGSDASPPGDPEGTLAVLFTSGTSGRAKGACLSWRNFEASALAAEERLGPAVRERWLACMPLFHVGGLSILLRSVMFGGAVRLHPRFDAAELGDALDAGDIAGVSLVPTMLARLLALRGDRCAPPDLRVLLLGGAAAAPELVRRALAAGYPVCATYGLTEATSQVATSAPPIAGASWPAPMRPLAGTEVRVVAGDGSSVPAGTPGEITVRGPTVMQGYLHDAAGTARALRDGWLYTGDIGFLDADGGLQVLDRRDDLIVSGGENVYPAEVEAVLLEHPSVADAGVAGIPDADLGARVVAWIVASPGGVVDSASLSRHCRERLAGFKQPREFRRVKELPRNAAGKLQRRRLAEMSAEG